MTTKLRSADAKAPPPVEAALDLASHIPARLLTLSSRIALHSSRASAKPHGMSIREWRIVQILGWKGASTINEVTSHVAMDLGGTSRAIVALEQRGLISRRVDKNDGRVSHVSLTPSGVRVHDEIVEFARQREKLLLARFSARERVELARLLDKLEEQVNQLLAG